MHTNMPVGSCGWYVNGGTNTKIKTSLSLLGLMRSQAEIQASSRLKETCESYIHTNTKTSQNKWLQINQQVLGIWLINSVSTDNNFSWADFWRGGYFTFGVQN